MIKKLNGLGKYVDIRTFASSEKLYIKNTRIPVEFLTNTVKATGNINSFFHLYPWLKTRKEEIIQLLAYVVEKGTQHSLYD